MFIADLLTAFILTIIILLPFYFLGRVGLWEGWIWFALLLFLFTWTGGAWVRPYGPVSPGYAWLPFLFFGLIFAFLIAAAVPPRPPKNIRQAIRQARAETEAEEATASPCFLQHQTFENGGNPLFPGSGAPGMLHYKTNDDKGFPRCFYIL